MWVRIKSNVMDLVQQCVLRLPGLPLCGHFETSVRPCRGIVVHRFWHFETPTEEYFGIQGCSLIYFRIYRVFFFKLMNAILGIARLKKS